MQKPILTLMEVYADLQQCGFKTSPKALSDGIMSGLYPFGTVLKIGETGRRTFQIRRADYEAWKEEFISCQRHNNPKTTESCSAASSGWKLVSTNTFTQEEKGIMWEVIIRSWARKYS